MYSSSFTASYRSKESLPREEAALAEFLSRHACYHQSAQVDFLRAREFSHLDDELSLRPGKDDTAFQGGDVAVERSGMAARGGGVVVTGDDGCGSSRGDVAVKDGDVVAQEGDVAFVNGGNIAVKWGNMADMVVKWGDLDNMVVKRGDMVVQGGDMAVLGGDMVVNGNGAAVKGDSVVVRRGEMAVKGGDLLVKGRRVCLDYAGAGLFSHWQHCIGMAGCELSLAYISANLATQALFPSGVGAEAAIRRRIFECLRIHDCDYCLAFTADAPSAWRLLGESYPFHSSPNLLTAFDHGYEPIDQMHTHVHMHTHMRASRALLLWPGLGFDSDDLRKKLQPPPRRTDRGNNGLFDRPFKGLFAYPLVSRLTGRRHSRKWISEARENGWHILLDLSGLGSESLPSLELSTHLPDFIICSFYKVFGFDPSGFGCLIIRRSVLGILGDSSRARAVGMVRIISRRDKERIRSSHIRSSSFSSELIRFSNDSRLHSPPLHDHESMTSFSSKLVLSSNNPHSHPHGHLPPLGHELRNSFSSKLIPSSNNPHFPLHGHELSISFSSESFPSSSNNPHLPPHGHELLTSFSSELIPSSSNNPHLPPHGHELATSFSSESIPSSNNPHSPPSSHESTTSFSFKSIPFSNNPHLPSHGHESTTSFSFELIPSSTHLPQNSHELTTPPQSSLSSEDSPSPRIPLPNDLSQTRQNSPVISHSRTASESNTMEENQLSPSTIDTSGQVKITVLDDSIQNSTKKSNGKQPITFKEDQSSTSRKLRSKGAFFWDNKSIDGLLQRGEIGITIGNMVDSSRKNRSVPTQIINNSLVERKGKDPRSIKQAIPDATKSTLVAPEEGSKAVKVGGGGVKGLFYGETLSPRPLPNLEEASVPELKSSPQNSVGYRARLQSSSFRIVGANRSEEENSGLVFCRGLDLCDQINVKILRYRQRCLVSWLITSLRSLNHGHQHLVVIYGSLNPSHYGSVIAFNLLDSHGSYLNPALVQKLADRSNISLGSGFIEGSFVMEPKERNHESLVVCAELPPQMCCSKGDEIHKIKLPVLNVTLGFLSNFSDVYRLWVFVAQFLDSTLYNQDLWHYRKLNQEMVVI